jgi:ketosteroid isomerase-like protein
MNQASETDPTLARIAKLESLQEIGQLPSRYARAVDSRDVDTLVDLFVSNVRVTKQTSGSAAVRELFEGLLRTFTTSVHFVPNHIIDLDEHDPDRARGLVYCRAEHEVGDSWIVMAITYTDDYRREAGRWRFQRRIERAWYAVDQLDRPVGPGKLRWDPMALGEADLPASWPTWEKFWGQAE